MKPTCDTRGHRCRYAAQPSVEEPCRSCDGQCCWTPEDEHETTKTSEVKEVEDELSHEDSKGMLYTDARWHESPADGSPAEVPVAVLFRRKVT